MPIANDPFSAPRLRRSAIGCLIALASGACGVPSEVAAHAASTAAVGWAADFETGGLAGWTVGEVTGVTEGAYEVDVSDGALRCRQIAEGAYQTAWRTLELTPDPGGALRVARLSVRLRHDAACWSPMVWLRLDRGDDQLAMHDDRSRAAAVDRWEAREITIVVPPEATRLVCGLGLIGPGSVAFDDVEVAVEGVGGKPPASPVAARHLDRALDAMEARSIHRDTLDWSTLRATAHELARGATTASDTHFALRHAISMLGDGHSFLVEAPRADPAASTGEDADAPRAAPPAQPVPTGRVLAGEIGYLHLPGHRAGSVDEDRAYADAGVRLLSEHAGVRGWIVDLRDNDGGTMWPMLAAVSPLLLEAEESVRVVGAFFEAGAAPVEWTVGPGVAGVGGGVNAQAAVPPPRGCADRPVVLLVGPRTASSGEAVAVAFSGRRGARTIGQPTAGLSTVNTGFPLDDGSTLVLTVGIYADRDGREFGGVISPDEVVAGGAVENGGDAALERAVAWLSAR